MKEVSGQPSVLSFPYRIYGNGIWVLEARINGSGPLPFIVDTGATRSAIFDNFLDDFSLGQSGTRSVNVYGMTGRDKKRTTRISSLQFGNRNFTDHELVVLKGREHKEEQILEPVGLIGMDLLSFYRIHADAAEKRINLIPVDVENVKIPNSWRVIPLTRNPFSPDDRGLHFMELRIGNSRVTALLDTGSEINVVRWETISNPVIKNAHRRLYEAWTIQGAVGDFDPVSFLTVRKFRSGQKHWEQRRFYLMDLNDLNILGIGDQPFAIAGGNLFSSTSVYIDFERDMMWLKPEGYDLEVMRRTGADTMIRSEPTLRRSGSWP
ncbi:MAG: aspartyl protease family protein [Hyphomonadaceae bacterium]|nr:aspartyl protease family protein [Hyphomonadaceae bacterium]